MTASVLGILALAALLGWILGGIVLRLAGLLIAMAGLAGLAISGCLAGVLVFVIGAVLWLGGHWHYALRHQEYKSPLARHLFCRWFPGGTRSDPPLGLRRHRRAARPRGCRPPEGRSLTPSATRANTSTSRDSESRRNRR